MCAHLHIPEDADLIVVEVGTSCPCLSLCDMSLTRSQESTALREIMFSHANLTSSAKPSVEAFELLIRSLLQRENEPAVLIYK